MKVFILVTIISSLFCVSFAKILDDGVGEEESTISKFSSAGKTDVGIEQNRVQNQDDITKKRGLRMSKIAREHLSDEKNPNNFPKLLGLEFPGTYFTSHFDTYFDTNDNP